MTDQANAFFLLALLLLATILLVFGMKYFSAGKQARLRLAGDAAYRELAERTAAAQSASATSLATVQADLAEVKSKLVAIEKVLREVA